MPKPCAELRIGQTAHLRDVFLYHAVQTDRGERLDLLAFIDAELARREAAEKQPRPTDALRPYRLSLKQLAKLRTNRAAA